MEEYINAPYYYNRKHFKKLVKIIPYMLIERNVSVHAVINLIIIVIPFNIKMFKIN